MCAQLSHFHDKKYNKLRAPLKINKWINKSLCLLHIFFAYLYAPKDEGIVLHSLKNAVGMIDSFKANHIIQ